MTDYLNALYSALAAASTAELLYTVTGVLAFLECAAFVGLAMPGESFVSFAGFLASRGVLKLDLLFPIVIASAFLGDVTGYWLGRRLGRPFLEGSHRFLRIPMPLIDSASGFFRRHGGKTVLIARFVGFLRALAPFMAGAARSRFWEFALFDLVGAGAWATGFLLMGYFLGEGYRVASRYVGRGGLVLVLAVAVVWAAFVLVRRYHISLSGLRFIFRKEVIFTAWFLAGATLMVAVAEDVAGRETMEFDKQILLWVRQLSSPAMDRLMIYLTLMGSWGFVVMLVAMAGTAFVLLGRRRLALLYAGAVFTGIALSSAVKLGFQRVRPEMWPRLVEVSASSFPSGHAVASSMAFWFLCWVLFRESRGAWGLVLAPLLGMVPLVVGFTRLYLGVHWPTDVIGGYALSLAMMAPWVYLYELAPGGRRGGGITS